MEWNFKCNIMASVMSEKFLIEEFHPWYLPVQAYTVVTSWEDRIHAIHEQTFSCIDCLKCANCCSTTGPLFTDKDISRIAKYLSMKPSDFTEQFLRIDEDNDYVLQSVPCTFLDADNHCSIYHVRPKACREYPHTDRLKQHQLLKLTEKNVSICPAVFQIVEKLKNQLK